MTGALGSVGQQQKRGAELYAKLQNAKGGILGRPIELLIEALAVTTDPAERSRFLEAAAGAAWFTSNLQRMEETQALLNTNVQEALALEVTMLRLNL